MCFPASTGDGTQEILFACISLFTTYIYQSSCSSYAVEPEILPMESKFADLNCALTLLQTIRLTSFMGLGGRCLARDLVADDPR